MAGAHVLLGYLLEATSPRLHKASLEENVGDVVVTRVGRMFAHQVGRS